MTFPSGGKYPLKVTSGVRVLPDTLPYPAPKLSPPKLGDTHMTRIPFDIENPAEARLGRVCLVPRCAR